MGPLAAQDSTTIIHFLLFSVLPRYNKALVDGKDSVHQVRFSFSAAKMLFTNLGGLRGVTSIQLYYLQLKAQTFDFTLLYNCNCWFALQFNFTKQTFTSAKMNREQTPTWQFPDEQCVKLPHGT